MIKTYVRDLPQADFQTLVTAALERLLDENQSEIAALLDGDLRFMDLPDEERMHKLPECQAAETVVPIPFPFPNRMLRILDACASWKQTTVRSLVIRQMHQHLLQLKSELKPES